MERVIEEHNQCWSLNEIAWIIEIVIHKCSGERVEKKKRWATQRKM